MAKFIIEVEEGHTKDCEEYPFEVSYYEEIICNNPDITKFDCTKYDLSTLKITKQEE